MLPLSLNGALCSLELEVCSEGAAAGGVVVVTFVTVLASL